MTRSSDKAGMSRKELLGLSLGALGVVYGDIGTSPLYAVKACFEPSLGLDPTADNVFGIISLFFWSLTWVVSIKYLLFILRADNHGEGGIIALLALITPKAKPNSPPLTLRTSVGRRRFVVMSLGLFGASLLYGDGIITPAISVLSAIEGLHLATPAFEPLVVPITIAVLLLIFGVQSRGTAQIGRVFGPAMLLWFVVLAAMGIPWIYRHPAILGAVDPSHAIRFFAHHGLHGLLVLGAVVLCVTGGEALYADMGHFGKRPIRLNWFGLVLPSLLLNYFGQGALILETGGQALENPFYAMVPGWALYPLIALSTFATVIAAQALISGAYSLTQQAVQLGYLPRVKILHTSRSTEGQIYVPRVNMLLMIGCIALVLSFGASERLAAAYGLAVTGTMAITSLLFYVVAREHWGWSILKAFPLVASFVLIDLAFLGANLTKLHRGGWIPLAIAAGIFAIMTSWKKGREAMSIQLLAHSIPLESFIADITVRKPPRVKGTAVFMTLSRDIAPSVLLHHFKHNKVLHERVILLSVITEHQPEVPCLGRARMTEIGEGFAKVVAHYGFMETPDVSEILELCEGSGLTADLRNLSFYLGRETYLVDPKIGMSTWRKRIFIFLSRNARPATEFFRIPPDSVIEIGSQIKI